MSVSKVGDDAKQMLFLVHFKDGYIKPVIGTTQAQVREFIAAEGERRVEDIEKIVLEQNYYPQNEDYYDI
ncbi:hypothetical protein J5690_02145 [bacterium]|nr:hypothetical protein [bacterium]